MVYTTRVDDQTLHLAVSGMLWNRSLVMVDKETNTLWSHLLGKAMSGPLKGTRLESIPSTMMTWKAWKEEYPETTVIRLARTSRNYDRRFYSRPADFVIGWVHEGEQAYAVGLDEIFRQNLLHKVINLSEGANVVVTFDRASTGAGLFCRDLDGQTLHFEYDSPSRMTDSSTGSKWNTRTGTAIEGPLTGRQLKPLVGIMSYAKSWRKFHPDYRLLKAGD